uniref:Sensor protein KdpD n=1 Tax=uncultured organism TaxID=155900 RepID=A0A7L9QBY3_9ZZZZ|nr:sensor protein KdpD [uncultured organism]
MNDERHPGAGEAGFDRPDARDRFLVAVAPDEQAEQLVRLGKRFADAMDAEWMVVSVETPAMLELGEKARNRRVDVLRLAESLGAETVTLDGPSAAAAIREYATLRDVTRIVVGESERAGWRFPFRESTAVQLMKARRGFEVTCVASREPPEPPSASREGVTDQRAIPWSRYAAGVPISIACTALAAIMFPYFSLTDLVMVYLLGATVAAWRLGSGPAAMVAVMNTLTFDFLFVPPLYSLAVTNFKYLVTFGVMLAVALIIASLVASVRAQTRVAGARERRTSLLYGMSRELVATRGLDALTRVAIKHVAETFASRAVVLLPDGQGRLAHPQAPPAASGYLDGADLSIAQWVFDQDTPAGLGTEALPGAPAQYLPLRGSGKVLGVLTVEPSHRRRLLLPEQRHLLETFAGQIALALERAALAEEAERARVAAETESLRNTLLASISHDLRTPLAVIAGASSALNDASTPFDEQSRRLLASSIETKANEMTKIISNVLDLMRLEAGLVLHREWQTVDDLVGSALDRLTLQLADHPVQVDLPPELPPVYVDGALMLQVFTNLLENGAKHTPRETRIIIRASAAETYVRVVVDDAGPGLPGDPERLFEKFQRGRDEGNTGGAGLGLAICRAIVNLHGGRIEAARRPGGGARFMFTLPVR